jgi:hypothetical protein
MNKIITSKDYRNNIFLKNKPILIETMSSEINTNSVLYSTYLSKLSNVPKYPDTLSLTDNLPRVRNDGNFDLNAAYSVARIIEWHLNVSGDFKDYYSPLTGQFKKYLSPAFIAVNSPNFTLANACEVVANMGICSEENYPISNFESGVLPSTIPESAKIEAQKYKYRISNKVIFKTEEELKTSLYINGPCIAVFDACLEIGTGSSYQNCVKSDTDSVSQWILPIVGYSSNGFILDTFTSYYAYDKRKLFKNIRSPYMHIDFESLTTKMYGEIWTTIDLSQMTSPFNLGDRNSIPQFILTNSPSNTFTESNSFILIIGLLIGLTLVGFFIKHMYNRSNFGKK